MLLNISIDNKLKLETGDLVGKMVAVLGITGTGKTNTAAVLIEELFTAELPMTIVDIEGEYYGLKAQFEILVAGRSENVDLAVEPDQAGQLALLSIERGISIVLDVSEFDEPDRLTFLLNYFRGLWEANFKRKRPYAVFVEEAHEFVPQLQAPNSELKTLITRLALRGRKRGFSVVVMSQRSAKVAKDVLTQASLLFLHQVVHPADMAIYKELIPLPARQVEEMVGSLQPGHCIVLYNHKVTRTAIRLRHTLHVGATPDLGLPNLAQLKGVDEAILAEFRQAVTVPASTLEPVIVVNSVKGKGEREGKKEPKAGAVGNPGPVSGQPANKAHLQKQSESETETVIESLKAELAARNEEIKRLKERMAELEVPSPPYPSSELNPVKVAEAKAKARIVTKPVEVEPVVFEEKQPFKAADKLMAGIDRRRQLAVQTLLKRLSELGKRQLAVLLFLYQHEGQSFSREELATWLHYSESYLRNNPPLQLLKLGVVERRRVGEGFIYWSNFSNFIQNKYQGVDPYAVIEQVSRVVTV